MARDSRGGNGKSKPELITEVLTEDPGRPTPKVQSAVWERFGEAVTAREIAAARRKLREITATATPPTPAEPVTPAAPTAARVRKERVRTMKPAPNGDTPSAKPRKKPRPKLSLPPTPDPGAAEVTVGQLSAILDVAQEVGGLRRLQEAVRAMLLVRERVGDVDERQLAFALDFLTRLTGKR